MGQAAALYSVPEARFQHLLVDPAFEPAAELTERVGFDKTFQGLTYTLSKGQDIETVTLLAHLFEPKTFLGPEIDWSDVPVAEERDFIVEHEARIYYHSPVTVAAIARCLARVTAEDVLAAFKPEEMNQLGVYPSVWNRHQEPDDAFNEGHIVQEFQRLKHFFTLINTGNNYCLVYVG